MYMYIFLDLDVKMCPLLSLRLDEYSEPKHYKYLGILQINGNLHPYYEQEIPDPLHGIIYIYHNGSRFKGVVMIMGFFCYRISHLIKK